MKRINLFRKTLAIVFAMAVVFTVSVKEVHYLFAFHEVHEHCENHLHDQAHHGHCDICKFDISVLDDAIAFIGCSAQAPVLTEVYFGYTSPAVKSQLSSAFLRGPPALA